MCAFETEWWMLFKVPETQMSASLFFYPTESCETDYRIASLEIDVAMLQVQLA